MPPVVNYTYPAKLVRVIDGDTAVLLIDLGFYTSTTQHVRIKGYNAPELYGTNAALAQKAKFELEKLIVGKPLVVQTTKSFSQSFARYLADVYVLEQTGAVSVAKHMISAGFDLEQSNGIS